MDPLIETDERREGGHDEENDAPPSRGGGVDETTPLNPHATEVGDNNNNSNNGGPLINHNPEQLSNFPMPNSNPNNLNPPNNLTPKGNGGFHNNSISSLPLQMIIYFHYHYTPLFFALNLCLFTYKG